jgi:uridine kinase
LRLYRDLREQRKPPLFLLRRGIWLARREPDLVAALVAKGCTPMTPSEAEALISSLAG